VTALRTLPEGNARDLQLVYAPGAGSRLNDAFGAYLSRELAARGIESWRFQFPYMEANRKAPDPPGRLEECWRALLEHVSQASARPIVASGRSMGGRIASQVVASGGQAAALVLFAYPLVPPGRNQPARDQHFPRIAVPTLFCSGNRDSFATPAQLAESAPLIPGARLHLLEGADHGFAVLKSSGRSKEDVWAEAVAAALAFLEEVEPAAEAR
jgi:uncharacterized protein